jgi:hypothetical protein
MHIMRRDLIVTHIRPGTQRDDERHRQQDEADTQSDAEIMAMADLGRQHGEGEEEEDLADQAGDVEPEADVERCGESCTVLSAGVGIGWRS